MRNHIKKLTLLLAVCVMMAVATPAWAQTGTDAYRTGGEEAAGQVQSGGGGGDDVAGATTGEGGGSLPFTGLDIALILGVGGVLMAVGLGTRRLTRHPDTA
jgi:hypothetical protein